MEAVAAVWFVADAAAAPVALTAAPTGGAAAGAHLDVLVHRLPTNGSGFTGGSFVFFH